MDKGNILFTLVGLLFIGLFITLIMSGILYILTHNESLRIIFYISFIALSLPLFIAVTTYPFLTILDYRRFLKKEPTKFFQTRTLFLIEPKHGILRDERGYTYRIRTMKKIPTSPHEVPSFLRNCLPGTQVRVLVENTLIRAIDCERIYIYDIPWTIALFLVFIDIVLLILGRTTSSFSIFAITCIF